MIQGIMGITAIVLIVVAAVAGEVLGSWWTKVGWAIAAVVAVIAAINEISYG